MIEADTIEQAQQAVDVARLSETLPIQAGGELGLFRRFQIRPKPVKVEPYFERDAVRVLFDDGMAVDVTGAEVRREGLLGHDGKTVAALAAMKRAESTARLTPEEAAVLCAHGRRMDEMCEERKAATGSWHSRQVPQQDYIPIRGEVYNGA